jgi:hypothetical protein
MTTPLHAAYDEVTSVSSTSFDGGTISGDTTFSGDVEVDGNATVGGTLGVTGAVTVTGTTIMNGSTYMNGTSATCLNFVTGTLGVSGLTNMYGNAIVGGTLAVTGDATFSGDIITGTSSTFNTSGDSDSKLRIGNIGQPGSWAGVAHNNVPSRETDYALAQAQGGALAINTSTDGYLSFRQSNIAVGDYDETWNKTWTFKKSVNMTATLGVTGATTLTGGEVVTHKVLQTVSTATNSVTSTTQKTIKKLLLTGVLPSTFNSANSLTIRYNEHGLGTNNCIVASSFWIATASGFGTRWK